MVEKTMNGWDTAGYVITVILTFGVAWGLRCVIQKAIVEASK